MEIHALSIMLSHWNPSRQSMSKQKMDGNSGNASIADMSSRNDSAERTITNSALASTVDAIEERNCPECELAYSGNPTWNESAESSPTMPIKATVCLLANNDECPSPSWMDQIDASDELNAQRAEAEKKRLFPCNNNPSTYKNATFVRIPVHYERRSLAREGTPMSRMSTYTTMAVVPEALSKRWKKRGDDAVLAVISALYAKILVVMGLAFPMTEVISTRVTSSSYLGFYLYLYFGSIAYFLFVFFTILRKRVGKTSLFSKCVRQPAKVEFKEPDESLDEDTQLTRTFSDPTPKLAPTHHGSFYLRIGAVAFGVGSMIYSGLEFAQYFEFDAESNCDNILNAVTPAARMAFTFMQMYFIFLNAKMTNTTPKGVVYFGLMHLLATNICVWLEVIIEETKHEILHFQHHFFNHGPGHDYSAIKTINTTATIGELNEEAYAEALDAVDPEDILYIANSLVDECKRSEVIGNLVQNASPLLFPCAIEYSLICAAILYVMWKNVAAGHYDPDRCFSGNTSVVRRSRHHYSIDCAKANKGLFAGIFVLVLTIISLILFFALVNNPAYRALAIMEVGGARFVLFAMAFIATLTGIVQVRELRFDSARCFDLDEVLLIFGQIGLMAYNTFTIIAGYYIMTEDEDGAIVLLSALAALFQAMTQTLFILDASRRNTHSVDQQLRKPGREVVTFLLVCNFAMWSVNTLEKSRADVNAVQLQFYGLLPWIIITNVSMPLAIFYRFHSTVVLCEIWKRCYKAKQDYT